MENQSAQKRTTFQGPCYLKMLVNNLVAGAIIGKSGSVIASIEQNTGCSLKLSPSNAFYPGTNDRVLILGGQQDQLNNALICILDKIRDTIQQFGNPNDGGRGKDDDPSSIKIVCKLAVPKSAVSSIIGKGGQQIRELQEQTQARVQVSSREEGLVERMITIAGNLEQVRTAVLTVASCIQTDPNLRDHMNVVYRNTGPFMGGNAGMGGYMNGMGMGMGHLGGQYGGMGGFTNAQNAGFGGQYGAGNQYGNQQGLNANAGGMGLSSAGGMGSSLQGGMGASSSLMMNNPNFDLINSPCDIIIQVPDQSIGYVIGKNGSCVTEIIGTTGARIQISQKGDLVPGTNERRIVISGTVHAVHNAHMLLLQRIHAANEFSKKNQGDRSSDRTGNNNNTNVDQQGVYVM